MSGADTKIDPASPEVDLSQSSGKDVTVTVEVEQPPPEHSASGGDPTKAEVHVKQIPRPPAQTPSPPRPSSFVTQEDLQNAMGGLFQQLKELMHIQVPPEAAKATPKQPKQGAQMGQAAEITTAPAPSRGQSPNQAPSKKQKKKKKLAEQIKERISRSASKVPGTQEYIDAKEREKTAAASEPTPRGAPFNFKEGQEIHNADGTLYTKGQMRQLLEEIKAVHGKDWRTKFADPVAVQREFAKKRNKRIRDRLAEQEKKTDANPPQQQQTQKPTKRSASKSAGRQQSRDRTASKEPDPERWTIQRSRSTTKKSGANTKQVARPRSIAFGEDEINEFETEDIGTADTGVMPNFPFDKKDWRELNPPQRIVPRRNQDGTKVFSDQFVFRGAYEAMRRDVQFHRALNRYLRMEMSKANAMIPKQFGHFKAEKSVMVWASGQYASSLTNRRFITSFPGLPPAQVKDTTALFFASSNKEIFDDLTRLLYNVEPVRIIYNLRHPLGRCLYQHGEDDEVKRFTKNSSIKLEESSGNQRSDRSGTRGRSARRMRDAGSTDA